MTRHLGLLIAVTLLAMLAMQACNVSPIPVPLPMADSGGAAKDGMGVYPDAAAAKDGGVKPPDMGAPDTTGTPDGAADGMTDGLDDGLLDGGVPDGTPDAGPDGPGPEASVADLCGEC